MAPWLIHNALWRPFLAWRLDVSRSLYGVLGQRATLSTPPPPLFASCPQFLHTAAGEPSKIQDWPSSKLCQGSLSGALPQAPSHRSHSQRKLSSLNLCLQRLFPQPGVPSLPSPPLSPLLQGPGLTSNEKTFPAHTAPAPPPSHLIEDRGGPRHPHLPRQKLGLAPPLP